MSNQDTVADMLTRIRNAQLTKLLEVKIVNTKFNSMVLNVLKSEGYIEDFKLDLSEKFGFLNVGLKYKQNGVSVINIIERVSKPSKRKYIKSKNLVSYKNGFGVYILSTSRGVMSDRMARHQKIGGELLCKIF